MSISDDGGNIEAMKVVDRMQEEVRSLKINQRHLQLCLTVSVAILGGATILLAVLLMTTYTQLQDLRQQLRRAAPTSSALPNSEVGMSVNAQNLLGQ